MVWAIPIPALQAMVEPFWFCSPGRWGSVPGSTPMQCGHSLSVLDADSSKFCETRRFAPLSKGYGNYPQVNVASRAHVVKSSCTYICILPTLSLLWLCPGRGWGRYEDGVVARMTLGMPCMFSSKWEGPWTDLMTAIILTWAANLCVGC